MSAALKAIKASLRLPSSKFPPRPHPDRVTEYAKRCGSIYDWQLRQRPATSHDTFTLHDGPPYANGDLHVGHALNKITKDIICRSQLARGKRISYIPGWDCHGLPIELKALEKNGWDRNSGIEPAKIRDAARKLAADTVQKQMSVFQSWGIMGDWNHPYRTMDPDFELRQLAIFRAMVQHGLVIRRHKPVYWSPSSRTALAEAEIEREEIKSTAAFVKFRIPAVVGGYEEPVHAVIWTTTPWTIPANQAIAINKDMQYVLVHSQSHGLLIVALSRVEFLSAKMKEELEILKTLEADTLLDCTYSGLPQFGSDALNRPIIHADFVTDTDGTGLVHCAPGFGNEDFDALRDLVAQDRVSVKVPVDNAGQFTKAASPSDPSLLEGKYVFKEGNKAVLDLLQSEGALIMNYQFKHKYPLDWRTKLPVMIRATAQWFADISKIRDDVIGALENVTYRPESGKSRLRSFIQKRSEWCISRQRAWGVPIPALFNKATGEAILTPESIDHIMNVIKQRGIDAWWSDPAGEPAWIMPGLSPMDYVRGTDTMDVWFDSGTSWSLLSELNGASPSNGPVADIYFEGSDQHRGWFQSSILTNIAYQRSISSTALVHAPYKELVTHGFTLDGNGKKMSKSIGNVISPNEIIVGLAARNARLPKGRVQHPLGPDALRLWAATGDWTSDVVISNEVVGGVHKSLDKYRVTFRVLLGMLEGFNPSDAVPYQQISTPGYEIHRLALLQLYQVVEVVRRAMAEYEFHKALAAINEWLAKDLSGMYLEAIKDSIYCDDPAWLQRKMAQTVLYNILCQFQHMLGPITPLLIEESYDFTPTTIQNATAHPSERVWEELPAEWNDSSLASLTEGVMAVNSAVKAAQECARTDKLLGQSLACEVAIHFKDADTGAISRLPDAFWKSLLVVSRVDKSVGRSEDASLDDPSGQVFSEFAKVLNESEREVVRASVASFCNNQRTAGNSDPTRTWTYCREVEHPEHRGQVWAYVLVTNPSQEKCVRCWTYTAEKPNHEETPAMCERCHEAMHDGDLTSQTSNEDPLKD